jgi:hypothetical protein
MPDPQKERQAGEKSPFVTMWFLTHTGTRYEMPDMTDREITDAHRHLDAAASFQSIHVLNFSGAFLMLPKRILKSAGVGDRVYWEAS